MAPTFGSGKICYIEIPATDIARSAKFYSSVFGWSVRSRGDGSTAFDDGVGQVSGTWVLDRPPASEPGLMVHIMIPDAAAIEKAIVAAGGAIVQPADLKAETVFGHFSDPAGNVLGFYQHSEG